MLPPKIKYDLPSNIKPVVYDCTAYYKIFSKDITKDDIIKLLIDNISRKEITYNYLKKLWWT